MQKYVIAALGLAATDVFAAGTETAIKAPDPSHALIQTLIGLTLVVVMILGLAWMARRFNIGGLQGQKHFTTLAVVPLSSREKAVLIDVAGQQILLGVAPGRVNTLHVFETPVVALPAVQEQAALRGTPGEGEFAKKLAEILRKGVRG